MPEEGARSGRCVKEGRGSDRSASEVVRGVVEVSGRTENYPGELSSPCPLTLIRKTCPKNLLN
jgi:hypothetical protein